LTDNVNAPSDDLLHVASTATIILEEDNAEAETVPTDTESQTQEDDAAPYEFADFLNELDYDFEDDFAEIDYNLDSEINHIELQQYMLQLGYDYNDTKIDEMIG